MPSLPPPPLLPDRGLGWLAPLLPVAASLVPIGVLSASTGHGLIAVAMVSATVIASAAGIDVQRQRWLRDVGRARQQYAAQLAALAPGPDWTEPELPAGVDPVGIVLARRAAATLRADAHPVATPRQPQVAWQPPDLRAELAPGVWLDLREAAAGGVGPHGVIIGATGSGKSELLQAIVLSLALRHRPTDLAFLLIDFKGGTALGELSALPHCAGLITNLAEDGAAVARMVRALDAELDRRQRLLRGSSEPGGNASGAPGALGALVIVIDEFSELLSLHPDVLEVVLRVGRLGRSLGIHLVLASQRLDESRSRELEAHLSWRLALRTFTEAESRAVIGEPGAAHLPREPGWALLRIGPGEVARLRVTPAPGSFRDAAVAALLEAAAADPDQHHAVARIWLPPPDTSPAAVDLLPDAPAGMVPVGIADDPVRRRVLALDPRAGHVAVVGRPGSGKSALLDLISAGAAQLGDPALRVCRVDPAGDDRAWAPSGTRGEVRLVVADDWGRLRQERPDLEEALVRSLVADPGIRLVLAAHRWADVRPVVRDLLSTRIELRLTDPFDSVFDRRMAAAVPLGRPGWGLFDGEPFLAALPPAETRDSAVPHPGFGG